MNEWIDAFCDLVEKWKPIGWTEESGQIASGIGPPLEEAHARASRPCLPPAHRRALRHRRAKRRRSSNGYGLADFRAELLAFPTGRHDDQVDAIGLIGQLLDRMVAPAGRKQAGPRRDRWDRPGDGGGNWKTV